MGDWECTSCTTVNKADSFLCSSCQYARPTSTRRVRPPQARGKFMDKVVTDLVNKATKRKPARPRSTASSERRKMLIKKKVDMENNITASQQRRARLMEKQFIAKADQITQLTQELEYMKTMVMQSSTSQRIDDQLRAIGELMVSTNVFSAAVAESVKSKKSSASTADSGNDEKSSRKRKLKDLPTSSDQEQDVDDADWEPTMVKKSTLTPRKTPRTIKNSGRLNYCPKCDFSCISENSLSLHLSTKHGSKKAFKCANTGCSFGAATKYFLIKHLTTEHGYVRPKPVPRKRVASKTREKPYVDEDLSEDLDEDLAKEVEAIENLLEEDDDEFEDDVERDKDWVPEEGEEIETNDVVADDGNPEQTPAPRRKGRPPGKLQTCPNEDCSFSTTKASRMFRHRISKHKEKLEKPSKVKKSGRRGRPPNPILDCPHEECSYKTSRKAHMIRHRISKHKEDIEVPNKPDGSSSKSSDGKKRIRVQKYSCEICGAKAVSMWYINRHMRLHTGEKPFICPHPGCDYRSYRKYHLTRHEANIHSDARPYKCDDCDYASKTTTSLRQHKITQHSSERNAQCNYCDYTTKLPEVLRSHKRSRHKNVCEPCSWEFTDEEMLGKHLNMHNESGLSCEYCPSVAPEVRALISHYLEQHNIFLETKIKRKGVSQPACDRCDYYFTSSAALEQHWKLHLSDGTILCGTCPQRFPSMDKVNEHTAMLHGFTIPAYPKKKKRSSKVRSRSHCCAVCNYEFTTASQLDDHRTRHRQNGSIVCSHCSYIAMEMPDLIEHCLLLHNVDLQATPQKQNKKFCCTSCNYLFPSTAKLDLHKRQHQADGTIKCRECPAMMENMEDLKNHLMLMHNIMMEATKKVDIFLCSLCNYIFPDKVSLDAHQACHMPNGTVCCHMCPYHAVNPDSLKIHLAEMHQIELRKHPSQSAAAQKKAPLLPNHNITDILYSGQTNNYTVPGNLQFGGDPNSYIMPPSCAYSGTTSTPDYDSRFQNTFASLSAANQLMGQIDKTDVSIMSGNSSITITNSNTKFSLGSRGASMVCGGGAASASQLGSGLDTRDYTRDLSSLIPGGLPGMKPLPPSQPPSKPPSKPVEKKNITCSGEPAKKRKVFPGLFS